MNSKISIIVPVYNSEKFLSRCLDSIISQTYENIEVICVNDGSTDNSLKILNDYQKKDDRIIVIDKKNNGVSAARNDGLKKASGDYITFVDSDDWLEKETIESLYKALIENKVDVVRGNYYINTENAKNKCENENIKNEIFLKNDYRFNDLIIKKLLKGDISCYIWLLLIKKECISDLLFKEDICLMEDAIFYIELMNKINSIYFLDKPLYNYFLNINSCTKSDKFYVRNMKNLVKVSEYLIYAIKNSSFNSSDNLNIINVNITNIILGLFFQIYKSFKGSKEEIKELFNSLLNDKKIEKLLLDVNVNEIKYYLKITYKLLLTRKFGILFLYYDFCKILKNIKK